VTSTLLTVDTAGETGVQVSCGAGDGGCAGVMTVSDGSTSLGTVRYDMSEQATPTLAVPSAVPGDAKEVTFSFAPTSGVAPPKPTTVPLQR
jgi:hypothetical protein